jgi:hypothetical protein
MEKLGLGFDVGGNHNFSCGHVELMVEPWSSLFLFGDSASVLPMLASNS